jgi:phage tail-like protein
MADGPPDPNTLYAQHRFGVEVSSLGVRVGFFTQVQGLSAQVDVLEYPEGGRNDMVHKLPTRIKHTNLTLKRGVTNETGLLEWFKSTVVEAKPANMSLTLYDSTGVAIRSWSFYMAYPVKWTGPDVNAGGNEIMTETLEIAHSGLEAHP